jgi:hypothetical protein
MLSREGLYVSPVHQPCPIWSLTKGDPDASNELGSDLVDGRTFGAVLSETESHEGNSGVGRRIVFARRVVLFPQSR